MRLLAIDFGTKKCGIAISDPLKIIAQPLTTIFYKNNNYQYLIEEIKKIINEYRPIEKIILGITKNINGDLSNTGKITMIFFERLQKDVGNIPIILFDEKYTSLQSQNVMASMNLSIKQKKLKRDAIAAQKILEDYINKC